MSTILTPGDLLRTAGLVDTASVHNTTGALVGACEQTAQVIYGWDVRDLRDRMLMSPNIQAVVYGPRSHVVQSFLQIAEACAEFATVTARAMDFRNGARLLFAYTQDDGNAFRGYTFQLVWVVASYDREPQNVVERELREARSRAHAEELQEVRSGYRGAVRAQYRAQQAPVFEEIRRSESTPLDRDQEAINNSVGAEAQRLQQQVRRLEQELELERSRASVGPEPETPLVHFPVRRQFLTEGEE